MQGICKAFPGVQALDHVDFELRPGEIHAILGENGAGKSTLVKIACGAYQPDGGSIEVDGRAVRFHGPMDARANGIQGVYQDWNLFPDLSVAENIFVGRMPTQGTSGLVDWARCHAEADSTFKNLNIQLDSHTRVADLRTAEKQLVEIARCISTNARIMIMDEPTAAIGPQEIRALFTMMRRVVEQGVSIIYISHKIEEVLEIADRVTVLRDGQRIDTVFTKDVRQIDLIRMMVGREVEAPEKQVTVTPGEELLRVSQLGRVGALYDINFTLREGEIVGVFGLLGAGQKALLDALFGTVPADSGDIYVDGKKAKQLGIGLVPEDRKGEGLILALTTNANLTLTDTRAISRWGGVLSRQLEHEHGRHWIEALGIRPPVGDRLVRYFSGGNQQKVVLGKWLESGSRILLLDQPTHGVDVGAKNEIYALLEQLVQKRLGIILVSTELPEILAMSDRILVMREGGICSELSRQAATNEKLLACATGERV
jgi:ABC-type sugar transport system ATPase subunit